VFAREGGTATRDISLSETSVADTGAVFQWATPDGRRVFFTANAGIAKNGASAAGTDLYEYDFGKPEGERLTDLSVDTEPGGAKVGGVLGASRDGSQVYFTAKGMLLPGKGNTLAQNEAEGLRSVYGRAADGELTFVGKVTGSDHTAQASTDGRYFLFESHADVTGYESGGAPEAYLYDSRAGSDGTVCVSCRQDGLPSVAAVGYKVLADGLDTVNVLHPPQSLSGDAGAPRAVFSSPDVLAPGAVQGQTNLYEWAHGQVFLLSSEPSGAEPANSGSGGIVRFVGASGDATDLYLTTPQRLSSDDDDDERNSIYDARIGGIFAESPVPSTACAPDTEGSCQHQVPQPSAAGIGATSATFVGPGNVKTKHPHRKRHPKKHKRHKKHRRRGHKNRHRKGGQSVHRRQANRDLGVSK
jgi:hypothetical protein